MPEKLSLDGSRLEKQARQCEIVGRENAPSFACRVRRLKRMDAEKILYSALPRF
jgi:hypothetical protein